MDRKTFRQEAWKRAQGGADIKWIRDAVISFGATTAAAAITGQLSAPTVWDALEVVVLSALLFGTWELGRVVYRRFCVVPFEMYDEVQGQLQSQRTDEEERIEGWLDDLTTFRRGPLEDFTTATTAQYHEFHMVEPIGSEHPIRWESAMYAERWPVDENEAPLENWLDTHQAGPGLRFAQHVYEPYEPKPPFDKYRAALTDAFDKWGRIAQGSGAGGRFVDEKLREYYNVAKMLAFFEIALAIQLDLLEATKPKGGFWDLGQRWKVEGDKHLDTTP